MKFHQRVRQQQHAASIWNSHPWYRESRNRAHAPQPGLAHEAAAHDAAERQGRVHAVRADDS